MKVIFSDLDGTLLLKGETELNKNIKKSIYSILDSGNEFAVASGRTYIELKHLFKEFENDIWFAANDGSLVVRREQTLLGEAVDKKLFEHFKSFTAHGKYVTYICSKSSLTIRETMKRYRNHVMKIESMWDISEDIYKISDFDMSVPCPLSVVYKNHEMNEYISTNADKGKAVRLILSKLEVNSKDAYAFGDNTNDLGMFNECGTSYAVAGALPFVKKCADKVTYNIEDEIARII